jgi:nitroreductase
MKVLEALEARRSVRKFTDQPVSKEQVAGLLDIARWSPSGGNLQPWQVLVATGESKQRVMSLARKALMSGAPSEEGDDPIYPESLWAPYRDRRFKVGEDMYSALGIPRDNKPARLMWLANNFAFFGAPVGLFFVIDKRMGRGQWAHLGMFMQSLMLAATAEGLATCAQESWARFRTQLHAEFQLQPEQMVYCGMALGYAANEPVNQWRSERVAVAEFTRFL